MAWTAPASYSTSEVVTATKLNTHVRDNTREIWRELVYVEFTANVSVTATTEVTANSVVSAGALTFTAEPILVEFQHMGLTKGTNSINVALYDSTTALGIMASTSVAGIQPGALITKRLTPSAASHTYNLKGWVDAGTGTVSAGVGGTGALMPGFIRILQKGTT